MMNASSCLNLVSSLQWNRDPQQGKTTINAFNHLCLRIT
jgi:hypothetical protein